MNDPNAIIAFYTPAKATPWGDSQSQSMAYSTDGGRTFTKYAGNPVITSDQPDFRDPKVFWYAPARHWCMILAVGQQMEIYSSPNLREWKKESSFGGNATQYFVGTFDGKRFTNLWKTLYYCREKCFFDKKKVRKVQLLFFVFDNCKMEMINFVAGMPS